MCFYTDISYKIIVSFFIKIAGKLTTSVFLFYIINADSHLCFY